MYNLSERVNLNLEYLINPISELTDYCFPLEKTSRKAYIRKPWITPDVRKSIQTQNKLFKDFLTTQTNKSSTKYKTYCNKLTHVKEMAKRMLYQNKFYDCMCNLAKIEYVNAEVKCCTIKIECKSKACKSHKGISNAINQNFEEIASLIVPKSQQAHCDVMHFMNSQIPNPI